MKPGDFMRYMTAQIRTEFPSWLKSDPHVELLADGRVRITDGRLVVIVPAMRQLRPIARMLELVADEVERRGYES